MYRCVGSEMAVQYIGMNCGQCECSSAIRLIPLIPVISDARQEPYCNNAFLTRGQAASLFLLCFSFTPLHVPSFGHLAGGSEEKGFTLSFPRSVLFSPLVSEHSCWWDGIPGLCLRSGRAQKCLMMGLHEWHLFFLL